MPTRLDQKQIDNINELMEVILSLQNIDECRAFLQDLCTVQELITFSQRLQVAKLLLSGETYESIRRQIPVSSTTITRINTALHFGEGGYQSVLRRLSNERASTPEKE